MRKRLVVQPKPCTKPSAASRGWCDRCAADLQEPAESMFLFAMQAPQCWMPRLGITR